MKCALCLIDYPASEFSSGCVRCNSCNSKHAKLKRDYKGDTPIDVLTREWSRQEHYNKLNGLAGYEKENLNVVK